MRVFLWIRFISNCKSRKILKCLFIHLSGRTGIGCKSSRSFDVKKAWQERKLFAWFAFTPMPMIWTCQDARCNFSGEFYRRNFSREALLPSPSTSSYFEPPSNYHLLSQIKLLSFLLECIGGKTYLDCWKCAKLLQSMHSKASYNCCNIIN